MRWVPGENRDYRRETFAGAKGKVARDPHELLEDASHKGEEASTAHALPGGSSRATGPQNLGPGRFILPNRKTFAW